MAAPPRLFVGGPGARLNVHRGEHALRVWLAYPGWAVSDNQTRLATASPAGHSRQPIPSISGGSPTALERNTVASGFRAGGQQRHAQCPDGVSETGRDLIVAGPMVQQRPGIAVHQFPRCQPTHALDKAAPPIWPISISGLQATARRHAECRYAHAVPPVQRIHHHHRTGRAVGVYRKRVALTFSLSPGWS